jgi:hypothetical protein
MTKHGLIIGNEPYGQIFEEFEHEYELVKPNRDDIFGSFVIFNTDSTFISYHHSPDGMSRIATTNGTYQFVNNNHVRLILERITTSGGGFFPDSDTAMRKDLGLFCVYEDSTCIKLIPSSGDLATDAQKINYSSIIDAFDYETREVPNFIFLPDIPVKSNNIQGVVNEYFQVRENTFFSIKSKNVNIVYSKVIRGANCTVILLEKKKRKQHYFLVSFPYSKTAGLYNPAAFRRYMNR